MDFHPTTLNVIAEAMEPPTKKRGSEPIFDSGTPLYQDMSQTPTMCEISNPSVETKNLQDTLNQIEEGVTSIKSSMEKKKPKMTLHQLNEKLDMILSILNKWDN